MLFDFWRVDADALQAVRADGTGHQFTRFMNSLLSAEASYSGLPISEVYLNLQTNLHDGGADSAVSRAVPTDSTGWMQSATVWQYKRSRLSDVQLQKEINKPSVREYIEKGHAYRLCVCEEEAAPETERKEVILADAQQLINAGASPPRILTASHLANWVSRFPALVLTYFYSGTAGKFFDLNTWKENITVATPKFVPMEQWTTTCDDVQKYADFQQIPPAIPFLLKGEAGIGKTRLGYESLAAIPGSAGLVIYCTDEQEACATYLAMRRAVRAILVADECDALLREKLKRAVAGFQERIRVIAINAESPSHSGGREYFLRQLGPKDVEEVLKINFYEVPPESRRRYADLCGGFIGLAADMCTYHPQIAASGDLSPVMQSVEDYYRRRLPDNQRRHIEAIALVSRVGFKRDQEQELKDLCHVCNLSAAEVKDTANKVHNSPGFVGIGGSYLYVRPKIIARVAFGEAWHRWGNSDPEHFLSTFPPSLLDQFLDRVNKSAAEEVRQLIAEFFRVWAAKLRPEDLADRLTAERLCTLTETRPDEFLPRLRWIVEGASLEQLLEVKGEWQGTWGPRRSIVWLCERLAAFPEYFYDVEPILLRLALAESEPRIGNNASHIWVQVFRIFLSGTSLPFKQRLVRLKEHIYSKDDRVSSLALDALDKLLNPYGSRMAGPLVVAGRIPPDEWTPKGNEAGEAVSEILDVMREMTHSDNPKLKQRASKIAVENMYNLLVRGFLEKLKTILDPPVIGDEVRAKAVGEIEHSLHLQADFAPPELKLSPPYLESVKRWKKSLELPDLRGRMLTALATADWHFSGNRREEWLGEIQGLAEAFLKQPETLVSQFDWLFSDAAKATGLLGEQVGLLDTKGQLLNTVIEASVRYRDSGFTRGYIYGLLSHNQADVKRLNELLDWVQGQDAQLAYELFIVRGRQTQACERTLALVKAGKLSVRHFRNLGLGAGGDRLTTENVVAILEFLLQKMDTSEVEATETAIDVVAYNCLERKSGTFISFDQDDIRESAWKVVEKAARNVGRESHWWAKILESLAPYDIHRAAKVAAHGLFGEGLNQEEGAGNLLAAIAQKEPAAAMEALGTAVMDEKEGWHFFIGRYDFIKSLPTQTVIDWIDTHGVEAARRLARQLPAPHLAPDGTPIVPPLTEHVLRKFGEDKRVFSEFVAGVHNLQTYVGDIADQHKREAELGKKFLNHPLRPIREWAQIEILDSEVQANFWKEWEEEQNIE